MWRKEIISGVLVFACKGTDKWMDERMNCIDILVNSSEAETSTNRWQLTLNKNYVTLSLEYFVHFPSSVLLLLRVTRGLYLYLVTYRSTTHWNFTTNKKVIIQCFFFLSTVFQFLAQTEGSHSFGVQMMISFLHA